jgi:hypothetical protein
MIRLVNLVAGLVALVLLAALYVAKTGTASDQQRLAELQADLARERGRISALEAEIALQEDHENLRRLARIYLGFEPVRHDQEIIFSELPRVAPSVPGEPVQATYREAIRR